MLAALVVMWVGWLLALPPRPSAWVVFLSGLPVLAFASWWRARRNGSPWFTFLRRTLDLHAIAVVLLYALGVQFADTHGITTDGVTYFTQLRSAIFDRDLDLDREYAVLGQPLRPNYVVPVGPVLLWLPLYLAVSAVDAAGRFGGAWSGPADMATLGLGLPYIRAALVSSFAIGAAGLMALQWQLRRGFAPRVAFIATLLTFAATPLYWYMVYEPSMTHAASFGFVALFVVASVRWVPGATRRQAIGLGVLIGLAFLARSQEALFAVFPGLLVLSTAGAARDRLRSALSLASWALVGALPLLLLQLGHSYVLFTRYEYSLVGQGGYLDPFHSRWVDTLFSSWHGFLSWTPVAYVAVIGTIAYWRTDWRWAASTLGILLLMAWLNGSTQDWASGWSFGGRRFTSMLLMLAPGLALVVDVLLRRPLLAVAPLVVSALWFNHLLMVQYTTGALPKDEPVSFGRIVRQQAEIQTRSPYFYPFAFPANVWFAWREGLPVDKYDLLSPEVPRSTFDLTFDRRAEKFMLEGWDVPGGDDWGPVWWIGGSPATLAVPLQPTAGKGLTFTVVSRTRFEEPPVRAGIAVDINGQMIGQFEAGVPGASTATITVAAADVARVVRQGFNRVSFRSLGVTPVTPGDARPPGPLASRPGRTIWPVAIYRVTMTPN